MVSSTARLQNRRNVLLNLHKLHSRSLTIHCGGMALKTSPANFILTSMKIMDRCAAFSTKDIVNTLLQVLICNANYCPLEHPGAGAASCSSSPLTTSPDGSVSSLSFFEDQSSMESFKTESRTSSRAVMKTKIRVTFSEIPEKEKERDESRPEDNGMVMTRVEGAGNSAEKLLSVLRQRVGEKCNTCAASAQAETVPAATASASTSSGEEGVVERKESLQGVDRQTRTVARTKSPRRSRSNTQRSATNATRPRPTPTHRPPPSNRLPVRNVKSASGGARIMTSRLLPPSKALPLWKHQHQHHQGGGSSIRPTTGGLSASASALGGGRHPPDANGPQREAAPRSARTSHKPLTTTTTTTRAESASDVRRIMKIIKQKQPRYVTLSVSVFTRILHSITKGLPKLKIVQPCESPSFRTNVERSASEGWRRHHTGTGKRRVSSRSRGRRGCRKKAGRNKRSRSASFKASAVASKHRSLPAVATPLPQQHEEKEKAEEEERGGEQERGEMQESAAHLPIIFVSTVAKSKTPHSLLDEEEEGDRKRGGTQRNQPQRNQREPLLMIQACSSTDSSSNQTRRCSMEREAASAPTSAALGTHCMSLDNNLRIQVLRCNDHQHHPPPPTTTLPLALGPIPVTSSDSFQSLSRPPTPSSASSASNEDGGEDKSSLTVSRSACTQQMLSRNVWECLKAQSKSKSKKRKMAVSNSSAHFTSAAAAQ